MSTCQIVVSKEFWRAWTLYEVFISTLSLNRTVCLVIMADVFIRWHSSIIRLDDYIIFAEETVPFNMLINLSGPFFDESGHIKLTQVSSAIALFL